MPLFTASSAAAGVLSVQAVKSATPTPTNVSASATSVTLLAANGSRLGVLVYNDSASALYIKYGATASTTSFTVKVPAFTLWEMPSAVLHTGRLDAIWDAATGAARVTELT